MLFLGVVCFFLIEVTKYRQKLHFLLVQPLNINGLGFQINRSVFHLFFSSRMCYGEGLVYFDEPATLL